ncbi:MAG: ParB/RepB/Spo0J family partition protein [Actinobacteria bacterium]|nr:ParB/RepB/Spo0J family partition protein [Actinomycetota bacterium]
MARKSGLGKGLGALITADLVERDEVTSTPLDGPILRDLPVGSIEPNPHQPRVHFDESTLSELTDSVRAVGVLQPVLVRPIAGGKFQLIAGERRWRAATRAGLPTIPAVVRPTQDVGSVEQALVENLHRQDLTPLEEAAAYQQLLEDFSMTHEEVASRVGKSRSAITNALRLLTLPPAIQHLLADGRLSAGHAKAILGTPDRGFQEHLARRAVEEGWSVRAVEEAVRDRQGGKPKDDGAKKPTPNPKLPPPGLLELESLLAEFLATKVQVSMNGKRGRIGVEFADLEDLERIYRRMTSSF